MQSACGESRGDERVKRGGAGRSALFARHASVLLLGAVMTDLRWLMGFLVALGLAGCGDDGSSSGNNGGAGGSGGAGACVDGGKGTLDVNIRIDKGVPANVTFTGPGDFQQDVVADTILEVTAGAYTVEARRTTTMGIIVGRAYYPEPVAPICLAPDKNRVVTVDYKLEPGSQKLWFTGGVGDDHTAAFDAEPLLAGGEAAASVKISGTAQAPRALAFDQGGNLWVADQGGGLLMYGRTSLGVSRATAPDVVLTGAALCEEVVPCGPRALAFDNDGGLWVAMPDRVSHFAAAALQETGEPTPDVTLSGPDVSAPAALAFDSSGSLWIANSDAGISKFAAERLLADDDGPADVVLMGNTPEPVVGPLTTPSALAFDGAGALWVGYFAPNIVARYEPEVLSESATLTPTVQLGIDVLALLESMAFDDGGNLWLGGSEGKIVRISGEQLVEGGDPTLDAVELASGDIAYAVGLAFNPPAKSTPIAR